MPYFCHFRPHLTLTPFIQLQICKFHQQQCDRPFLGQLYPNLISFSNQQDISFQCFQIVSLLIRPHQVYIFSLLYIPTQCAGELSFDACQFQHLVFQLIQYQRGFGVKNISFPQHSSFIQGWIRSGLVFFQNLKGIPIYAPNVQWLIILDQIRSLEAFSFISSYYFLLSLIHQPSKSKEFKANERQIPLIHFQNRFSRFFQIIVIAIG